MINKTFGRLAHSPICAHNATTMSAFNIDKDFQLCMIRSHPNLILRTVTHLDKGCLQINPQASTSLGPNLRCSPHPYSTSRSDLARYDLTPIFYWRDIATSVDLQRFTSKVPSFASLWWGPDRVIGPWYGVFRVLEASEQSDGLGFNHLSAIGSTSPHFGMDIVDCRALEGYVLRTLHLR